MAKKEKENLKKSHLLAALKDPKTSEPRTGLTKESLAKELAKDYAFIPEFFDYLFATYMNGGKFEIAEADDEGNAFLTVKAVGQVRTNPRPMFTCGFTIEDVEYEDDTTVREGVISCEMGTLMPGDALPEGSSLSPASAAKLAKSAAYREYKLIEAALVEWVKDQKAEAAEQKKAA